MDAPTVVSLFAGCGGSSLGYSMAGYRELLAVEWDKNACETFRLNFPGIQVWEGDIARLSGEEALQLTDLESGQLDVLDGSPPCQGFSTAGKRVLNDPRNSLFKEYVHLLQVFQPKVLVMENVSGMVKGKMKLVFTEILRELKASGYKVSARLMNAMYFNVPQSRQRIIFIGVREDLGIAPSHPGAEGRPITTREALEGYLGGDTRTFPPWLREVARLMIPGNYSTEHALKALMRVRGKSAGAMNTKLLAWDRCPCTLMKSEIAATGIIHPSRERFIDIGEAMRIGGYPAHFSLIGERKMQWNRIGNSAPPLFMRAIANHIKMQILHVLLLH